MRKLLLVTCLMLPSLLFAAIKPESDTRVGTAISPASPMDVKGTRYTTSSTISVANRTYWTQSAYGLVKLTFPDLNIANRPTGNATVALSISYEIEENGAFTVVPAQNYTLSLNLTKNTATDVAYVKIDRAQRIKVQVLSTGTTIPNTGWSSLVLEANVVTESFDLLGKNTISGLNLSHDLSPDADGNLAVHWTALAGAEAYELEWTYVSDHKGIDKTNKKSFEEIEIDRFLFRNNSSRVEVSGLGYAIPLVYEQGVILYRVRAIGKNLVNSVPVIAKTEWTAPDGLYGTVAAFPVGNKFRFDGWEEKLNWQASLSFGEEGRNKAIVNYYDGSARNRQGVTRINTDQRAVIGETLYDYNGRPSIQLLPVPVKNNLLNYTPHFNLIGDETVTTPLPIDKSQYDIAIEGTSCTPLAPKFSPKKGASNYYSGQNNFETAGNTGINLLNKSLIPNANLYPYTQTVYTQDNTGRIAQQSGVGATHIIGSKKETSYQYAVPQQAELTRLFGNQVGYASHYKKNVVVDPNKQTSVSYLDMDGKVVATALAGGSPETLKELEGEKARHVHSDLLASGIGNELTPDKIGKKYVNKFSVTGENIDYVFDYDAVVPSYKIRCQSTASSVPLDYYIDGVVDVTLELFDDCGKSLFKETATTTAGASGANKSASIDKTKKLAAGEYELVKTIKINEEKLEAYWQTYLTKTGTCVLTNQNYLDAEILKINTSGCGVTCSACRAQALALTSSANYLTAEEKERINSLCDDLCNNEPINCRASLEAMRGDVSPGGQYGQLRVDKLQTPSAPQMTFDENNQPIQVKVDVQLDKMNAEGSDAGDPADNAIDASSFPLSVYNVDNRLVQFKELLNINTKASWHTPLQITPTTPYSKTNHSNQVIYDADINLKDVTYSVTDYKDRNGDIFYVNIFKIPDGNGGFTYKPALWSEVTPTNVLIEVDRLTGVYKTPIRNLQNLADFEMYWQPNWANYLLPYHPEYPYLVECTSEKENLKFDYAMMDIGTPEEASASPNNFLVNGVPVILGTSITTCLDPFLKANPTLYARMKDKYTNYALFGFDGGTPTSKSMAQMATISVGCPRGLSNCQLSNCSDGILNTVEEWNVFKGFYLAEKQKLLAEKALKKAVDGAYYNGCIGHKDYIEYPDAGYFRRPVDYIITTYVPKEDCHKEWYDPFNWTKKCNYYTQEEYSVGTTYPYLNPAQVCFVGRAGDYVKKTQRFYPTMPATLNGTVIPKRCVKFVNNAPADPIKVMTECDEDVKKAADQILQEAQQFKYESCGLCPLAADVEQFLLDLKGAGKLSPTSNLLVSCDLSQYPVKLGEVLRRQLNAGNSPEIYWNSVLSLGNKRLEGKLFLGGTVYATLSLQIPSNALVDFTNLPKLCCLSVSNVSPFTSFTMQSYYIENDEQKKFAVQGEFSFALNDCSIPPRCYLTDDAYRLSLFLNTLCIQNADLNKNHDLLATTTKIFSGNTTQKAFYNAPIRRLVDKDDAYKYKGYLNDPVAEASPSWTSSLVGGNLSGQFSAVLPASVSSTNAATPVTYHIEVRNFPTTYSYSQISEFLNFEAETVLSCANGNCNRQTFKADAIIINGDTKTYVPVILYVQEFSPVLCRPVQAPVK